MVREQPSKAADCSQCEKARQSPITDAAEALRGLRGPGGDLPFVAVKIFPDPFARNTAMSFPAVSTSLLYPGHLQKCDHALHGQLTSQLICFIFRC